MWLFDFMICFDEFPFKDYPNNHLFYDKLSNIHIPELVFPVNVRNIPTELKKILTKLLRNDADARMGI